MRTAKEKQEVISDTDLDSLVEMARCSGHHWQVADTLLECRTCGSYQLQVTDNTGEPQAVLTASDILDCDRERLVYLAAAANLAPALAAEVRQLRALLANKQQEPVTG